MFYLGYRPIGREHHKNVFEFLRKAGFDKELTDYFDNIRKERNKFVYGVVEGASKENAEEVIESKRICSKNWNRKMKGLTKIQGFHWKKF